MSSSSVLGPYEPMIYEKKSRFFFQLRKLDVNEYIDIKMCGDGDVGEDVEIVLKDDSGEIVYKRIIRKTREMGVYGIHFVCKKDTEYEIVVAENVVVKQVIVRQYNDVCGLSKYMTSKSKLNKEITKAYANRKGHMLTWFVTWQCNYHCPYCWERLEEKKYRGQKQIGKGISPCTWADGINRLSPRELYITGGEPTIYKDLPKVIELLDESIAIRMTTNFGQTFNLSTYEKMIIEGRFLSLTASYHPTEVSKEIFFDKVRQAKTIGIVENCDFSIEMVLYPDDLSYAEELMSFCEEEGIDVSPDIYNDPKSQYRPDENEIIRVQDLIERARIIKSRRKLERKNMNIDERPIVICGAGRNGKILMHSFIQCGGIEICCFADNRAVDGQCYCGVPVYTYSVAANMYKYANYIISVKNKQSMVEIASELSKCGITGNQVYVLTEKSEDRNFSVRGKKPIWCPAGMLSMHMDPEGELYTCMLGISNQKLFGRDAMPIYKPIGSIFDDNAHFSVEPVICWESYRCSACDYDYLEDGMMELELFDSDVYLPLPE